MDAENFCLDERLVDEMNESIENFDDFYQMVEPLVLKLNEEIKSDAIDESNMYFKLPLDGKCNVKIFELKLKERFAKLCELFKLRSEFLYDNYVAPLLDNDDDINRNIFFPRFIGLYYWIYFQSNSTKVFNESMQALKRI